MSVPKSVKAELAKAMKAALQAACIDNVDPSDDSRATRVVIGRYVGSITRDKIVLEVHTKHPLGPERDERRSTQGTEQTDARTWDLPPETLGGSRFRWERGTVQIRYHLRTSREDAVDIIEAVTTRVKHTLETEQSLIGITDDFGRRIHALEVTDDYSYTNEAGNPATERAFVDWRALVSYQRTRV